MSFIVNRPAERARLRTRYARKVRGRTMRYTMRSYAPTVPKASAAG